MEVKGLTPILNVSDIASTVAWFEKWGWKKLWDWGTPPTFGAVGSGDEVCMDAGPAPLASHSQNLMSPSASG